MLPRLAPGLLSAAAAAPAALAAAAAPLAAALGASSGGAPRAPPPPPPPPAWRRGLHTSAPRAAPQQGGYMFTGRGAFQGDPDPEVVHKYLVTGACGQIGALRHAHWAVRAMRAMRHAARAMQLAARTPPPRTAARVPSGRCSSACSAYCPLAHSRPPHPPPRRRDCALPPRQVSGAGQRRHSAAATRPRAQPLPLPATFAVGPARTPAVPRLIALNPPPPPPPLAPIPRVGKDNVIASDVKTSRSMLEGGPFAYLDVQDRWPGRARGAAAAARQRPCCSLQQAARN
jgi:hypothetical protein